MPSLHNKNLQSRTQISFSSSLLLEQKPNWQIKVTCCLHDNCSIPKLPHAHCLSKAEIAIIAIKLRRWARNIRPSLLLCSSNKVENTLIPHTNKSLLLKNKTIFTEGYIFSTELWMTSNPIFFRNTRPLLLPNNFLFPLFLNPASKNEASNPTSKLPCCLFLPIYKQSSERPAAEEGAPESSGVEEPGCWWLFKPILIL